MLEREYDAWPDLKTEKYLLILLGLSFFFYSFFTRSIVSGNSINEYFNIFWIVGGSFLLLTYAMKRRLSPGIGIMVYFYWSLALLSNIAGNRNLFTQCATFFNSVLPLMLTGIHLRPEVFQPAFEGFLKVMNVMVLAMLCIGIPDLLTGGTIQQFMFNHVFVGSLASMAEDSFATGIYRLYFIFGHPLDLAWIFLLFFSLNVLNNRYNKTLIPTPWAALITLTGVALCNSRTALIVGALMVIVMNGERKRQWIYWCGIIAFVVAILFVPIVRDNVAQRFISKMQAESYSGGRNEAVQMALGEYGDLPGLFIGQGLGHSREITTELGGFINSFEYPIFMYAYDYSVAGTIILYWIILVIPLAIFIKERRWLEAGLFLLLTLYMNGQNLLADSPDGMAQFCYAIMLMIHIGQENSVIPARIHNSNDGGNMQ